MALLEPWVGVKVPSLTGDGAGNAVDTRNDTENPKLSRDGVPVGHSPIAREDRRDESDGIGLEANPFSGIPCRDLHNGDGELLTSIVLLQQCVDTG